MTFVWKITCRRLQSSGTLTRFAEGALSERERGDVDAHIARCPACKAAVADALAVVTLLRSCPTAPLSSSIVASGNLWAKLEAEITRTPQDVSVAPSISPSAPVSVPRLQRFGHWLATPGALPFGSVAAAAVVVMVGAVVYQRMGGIPADQPVASVTAVQDSNLAEIHILPPPMAAAPFAADEAKTTSLRARSASAVAVALPQVKPAASAAIKSKVPVRRFTSSIRLARRSAFPTPPRPSAPDASPLSAAVTVAAPMPSASVATLAPVASPAQTVAARAKDLGPVRMADGFRGGRDNEIPLPSAAASENVAGSVSAELDTAAGVSRAGAGAGTMMAFRAVTGDFAVTSAEGPAAVAAVAGSSNTADEELEDVPAVRSVIDLALQRRRQRSLFSYATR
jgi:hypothetical protein